MWDGILLDLPDPSEAALGKLYSQEFYSLCLRRLTDGGVVATQATSPFRSREAFWCIVRTLRAAAAARPGATVTAWHTEVPTFGTWGFAAAVAGPMVPPERIPLPDGCRFLAPGVLPSLAAFPPDMAEVDGPVSTLDLPAASTLYRRGWHRYLE
jgi:spermidine synthase